MKTIRRRGGLENRNDCETMKWFLVPCSLRRAAGGAGLRPEAKANVRRAIPQPRLFQPPPQLTLHKL